MKKNIGGKVVEMKGDVVINIVKRRYPVRGKILNEESRAMWMCGRKEA